MHLRPGSLDAVKARSYRLSYEMSAGENARNERRWPKRLFASLVKRGCCVAKPPKSDSYFRLLKAF